MMLGLEQHEFDVFLFVCRDWGTREFLKSFAAAVRSAHEFAGLRTLITDCDRLQPRAW